MHELKSQGGIALTIVREGLCLKSYNTKIIREGFHLKEPNLKLPRKAFLFQPLRYFPPSTLTPIRFRPVPGSAFPLPV